MERGSKLENEIYEFLESKAVEYSELHYLRIYNAVQAASFKMHNKLENEAGIKRFEKWSNKGKGKE